MGKGSTFTLTLADQGTDDDKAKAERPRVLLVDDYPDAREMYSEYLEFSGFDVIEAANGMEALQRAVDAAPDIILMDLSLPVMDGWEATRRLKADERTGGHSGRGADRAMRWPASPKARRRPAATRSSPSRVCPKISSRRSGRCSTGRRIDSSKKTRRSGKYAKTIG